MESLRQPSIPLAIKRTEPSARAALNPSAEKPPNCGNGLFDANSKTSGLVPKHRMSLAKIIDRCFFIEHWL